jgi:hypothetical protein
MFANYEYFVNDQFSLPSERNRSAFARGALRDGYPPLVVDLRRRECR